MSIAEGRRVSARLVDELTGESFDGLTLSARAVYLALRASDCPLTQKEIASAADVSINTVSLALAELRKRGVVSQQSAPRRQHAHRQYYASGP